MNLIEIRKAAQILRGASSEGKNKVLSEIARLLKEREPQILAANKQDLESLDRNATSAFRDRLALNPVRIDQMIESLNEVIALVDPVNEIVEQRILKNGLKVKRVKAPLGVILMIFESRPNVAIESFSLAFKSGNAAILRGGKESMRTTAALYEVLNQALSENDFPVECLWGITDPDRSLTAALLKESRYIDVVVPRGGDKLIEFVVSNSRIPIIKNDRGLCHVYAHEDADLKMAENIVKNAKTQRPGVCNSMETLLVHERVAVRFLPSLHEALKPFSVKWFGCSKTLEILNGHHEVRPASAESWDTEYLDFIMNCKIVASFDEAIAHIETHGSRHSESIVTRSAQVAKEFQATVDAAAVYWNASTRFTDGHQLGLGGELGISTQKLHVRGPVGLSELTSARWIIDGEGQTRA